MEFGNLVKLRRSSKNMTLAELEQVSWSKCIIYK